MRSVIVLVLASGLVLPVGVWAGEGLVTRSTRAPFHDVAAALERAIADEGMGLVCRANAQQGAASRGVTLPGNRVFAVFRPDFAIRMIRAYPPAGIEAPIRIYLYENQDGTTTLAYRTPSSIFAPYGKPELTRIGAELDPIFDAIANRTLGRP